MGLHDEAGSGVASPPLTVVDGAVVVPPGVAGPLPSPAGAVVAVSSAFSLPQPAASRASMPTTTNSPASTRLSNVVHLRRPFKYLADLRRSGEPSSDEGQFLRFKHGLSS